MSCETRSVRGPSFVARLARTTFALDGLLSSSVRRDGFAKVPSFPAIVDLGRDRLIDALFQRKTFAMLVAARAAPHIKNKAAEKGSGRTA
jgi:hypothetical protein